MSVARRVAGVLAILACADLLLILISGGTSLAGLGRVTTAGLWLRLALVGVLLSARFYLLAEKTVRISRARLVLVLLLLPTLAEFHLAGGRIGGDGVMYFVYTRSLVFDHDLDFTNEYEHFGLLTRGDLSMPTPTGLRRSIFAVGPGLLALPFYLIGHGVAQLLPAFGQDVVRDGYSSPYTNAVGLSGLAYGFCALLLVHGVLRRYFRGPIALGATLLLWGATFLYWYMVQQPAMSHAPSTFMAALVLWLWDRERDARTARGYALLGFALGVAMCVRWQNGALLILPALELLRQAWTRRRALAPLLAPAAALVLGVVVGAGPQMWAWKTIYGEWLLRYPPHGADFLRLGHPFVLETLFSSRHGLLSWTPVCWAGFLGFWPLWRRRPQLALPLLLPLMVMTYVNMCSGDWWAGGSFSNRRFDSLLPLFGLGLAATLEVLEGLIRRRPQIALAVFALPFLTFNLTLAGQVHRGLLPRDETVDFPDVARGSAQVLSEAVGSPPTWPASWIFAWRYERPPSQYDLLVGRYLFYRQNNLGGVIALGQPGDEPFLGEGWARRESEGGTSWRRLRGRARVFTPLDVAEDLNLNVQLARPGGPREVRVSVNGRAVGSVWADAAWSDARLFIESRAWQRELNELTFEAEGEDIRVGTLTFLQRGRP